MGFLKWHKRDHNAALRGMAALTLEERGAYNTILDLIYAHDGELEDNDREIARWLRANPRTWRRLRARLLSLGKLYVREGCLRNERADDEIRWACGKVLNARKANYQRWATLREIKALRDPTGILTTTTKKTLSANVVPLPKRTTEKDNKN
jgi:uncharacterized protein YdaU (DUF1376 family)